MMPTIGILLLVFGLIIFWLTQEVGKTTKKIVDDTEDLNQMSAWTEDREPYDFTNVTDLSMEYERICAIHEDARYEVSLIKSKIKAHEDRILTIQEEIYKLGDEENLAREIADELFDRVRAFEDSPEWEAWHKKHGDQESSENIADPEPDPEEA